MGAWDTRSFGNDQALDWLGDFLDRPSDDTLRATFIPPQVGGMPGFLGRLFGARAASPVVRPVEEHVLAAAEVIAAMRGHPLADAPDDFARLPRRAPPDDLVLAAIRGVDSILDESSELHSLWRGTGDFSTLPEEDSLTAEAFEDDYAAWIAGVRDLRERLTRP